MQFIGSVGHYFAPVTRFHKVAASVQLATEPTQDHSVELELLQHDPASIGRIQDSRWFSTFSAKFQQLKLERHQPSGVYIYSATNPYRIISL